MHEREFAGRSQVAKSDLQASNYKRPIAFRGAKPIYTAEELAEYNSNNKDIYHG